MHQIRVHLAGIGHAVLGDASYGAVPVDPTLGRAMLHAAALGFAHPTSGEYAEFHAPLPPDMEEAVARRRVGEVGWAIGVLHPRATRPETRARPTGPRPP
jgi:23S rRNA pseudouridine1911/1915/1917 synthase